MYFMFVCSLEVNVYKQPITDSTKHSKKGLLSLELDEEGKYITVEEGRGDKEKVNEQKTFYALKRW